MFRSAGYIGKAVCTHGDYSDCCGWICRAGVSRLIIKSLLEGFGCIHQEHAQNFIGICAASVVPKKKLKER